MELTEYAVYLENIGKVLDGALKIAAFVFAALAFRGKQKIKQLKKEIEYLKKRVHRATNKVDPESDRRLIHDANECVQIMGINALGPLHHAREEIIDFLKSRHGCLKIVLLDPGSVEFREREKHEHDGSKRILSEWKASLAILNDIASVSKGNMMIRLRFDRPDRSLLIVDLVDKPATKSKMLVSYYPEQPGMRGYSGGQFLAEFVLERDRDSFFKNAKCFEDVWQTSKAVELDQLVDKYLS
jgi:hypothetical protein